MSPRAQMLEPELEKVLDDLEDAFEEGDHRRVTSLATRLLERHPDSIDALHYRAAAHAELGELEQAEDDFLAALKRAPDDAELLLGFAELRIAHQGEDREAVEHGLTLCARGRKAARKQGREDLEFEFCLLEGIGLNQIGEGRAALERLDAALALSPNSVDAQLERALALFELCRFAQAKRELEKVLEIAPDDAWAHHHLGLIAEREGEAKTARRHFARAHALAPEDFPKPVRLTQAEFDAAVEDAVERLPAHVKKYLENTTIAVEPIPRDEDLTDSDPPLSPVILGVFRGVAVGARSVTSAHDHFPASIVLYQRNLERFARTRDELIEQIGITLMHEVGHLMGLDEEDLWERGLD